jgi:hypothetical protein
MALLDINWNPGRRELRQFAGLWILFFGSVGAYCRWVSAAPTAATVVWIVAALGLVGLAAPHVMRPIYVVWMALALPIGWTVSHLVLILIYFGVIAPVGFTMRLFGYDPMKRSYDRSLASYWVDHDPAGEPARYFKQY